MRTITLTDTRRTPSGLKRANNPRGCSQPAPRFHRTAAHNPFKPKPQRFFPRDLTGIIAIVATLFIAAAPGCMKKPVKPQAEDTVKTELTNSGERYYYYALSRFFKNKEQLADAIDLMGKVGALDPDSGFIQRELALLHLKNKAPQKALNVLQKAIEKHPEDISLLNIYGRLLEEKNDLEGAAQIYEKILAIDPLQQNAYLFLGGVYSQLEQKHKAAAVYRKMVKKFPEAYAGYFFLGRIYQQQGKRSSAEKMFLKTLSIKHDLEEPKFELVSIYLSSGKPDKAIDMYRDLLEANPKNIKAAMGLALLYSDTGKTAEAGGLFSDLGRQSLSDLQVVREIVRIYIDLKKFNEAVVILKGILESGSANRDLYYLLGIAHEGLGDSDRAILEMEKISPEDRFFQDAVVRVAFLYQDQKKHNKAIKHMQQAIVGSPDKPEFYFYLGTLYEEAGALEDALDVLLRGQAKDPENIKIQFRLGVVHDKMGNKDESIRAMKRVIQLDASYASALNYLGYTYADMGKNLDEAERLIEKALKLKPDDGYIIDSLGWVYFKQGRYVEALETLIKAVGIVPDDPIILEHLGDAYLKQEKRAKALESYKRALQVKEKDREALENKIQELKGGPAG